MSFLILILGIDTVASLLVVATALPASGSTRWWVRMWDFPRAQLAGLLAAALVAVAATQGWSAWPLVAALGLGLGWQLWRILPYTPVAGPEMQLAPPGSGTVTLLAANVLMENRAHDRVRALVAEVDPDVLLLMETDRTWIEALEPVLAGYPTVVRTPRDDCYGMVFATRLAAASARTVRLSRDETPALLAELADPEGRPFRFIGLHPQPPVPGQDTDERDAQILYAARFARATAMPLVVMGDFNDVAWSRNSHRFKRVGGYLDPRVGRGLFASFDARRWWFRCPIDQIFVTGEVAVESFRLGPKIGSDHFPLIARISLDPALAAGLNRTPEQLAPAEAARIDARVEAWRRQLGPQD